MTTRLIPVDEQPDPNVVKMIEEALADATAGKLRAVFVVGVHANGGHTTWKSGGIATARFVYALNLALHRIMVEESVDIVTFPQK